MTKLHKAATLIAVTVTAAPASSIAQDGRSYALQAIATMASAPRLCPGTRVNASIAGAAAIGADLDLKASTTKVEVQAYAVKLQSQFDKLGAQSFCLLLTEAWGPTGAIIPGLLGKP